MMVQTHNNFKHLTRTLGWADNTRTALRDFNLLRLENSHRVERKVRVRIGGGIVVDEICGLFRVSNTYLPLCPDPNHRRNVPSQVSESLTGHPDNLYLSPPARLPPEYHKLQ
jgi:hypothetical protein